MDQILVGRLVEKASRLGAQGYHVLCWIPPSTASENPEGQLLLKIESMGSASEKQWFEF